MAVVADPSQDPGRSRGVHWILRLRLILALLGLGAVLFLAVAEVHPPQRYFYAGVLFLAAVVLDLVYFLMRRWVPLSRVLTVQFGIDYLLVTGIIYVTGGSSSVFTFLYFMIILGAAMLVSQGVSLVFASLATVGTTAVTILYYLHHTVPEISIPLGGELGELTEIELRGKAVFLVGQGIAFHIVALLGGILAGTLRRLTLLYGLLLENMSEGLLAVDAQRRVAFLNQEARTLLGIPAGRPVDGEPLREVLHDGEAAMVSDLILSQEGADWEVSLPGEDGPRSVNIRVSAIRDRKGRMRGAVAVLTDLTLRKRLEAAERTAGHLEGLREVAAGIAHEIRNPLASIRGSVQELSRGRSGDDDERELAGIIYRESDRLDDILQEFLQFTGMRDPVLRPLDVTGILDEVVVLLENRDGVQVGSIGKAYEGSYRLQGDRGQLQQVFLNLGINALETSPPGGKVRFEIRTTRMTRVGSRAFGTQVGQRVLEIEAVEVAVHDECGGIEPEVLPKIFTPFFTTKSSGTGLGLAVVNRIVRGHGGEVVVDNEPGKGCIFRVRLPLEA